MVKGVFGGDARALSLAAAFPRMVEMERDHGGLFKALFKLSRQRKRGASPNPQGVLHSFRGGMAELVDRLAAVLRDDARVDWIDGAVSRIAPGEEEWQVEGDFGEHDGFDAVAACAPAHVAASQLAGVGLGEELAAIPYVPMAVITLAFPREAVAHDLDGFGLLIPTFEHHRLLGVLWSSSIFTGRAPDGHVLMRCMAGGAAIPDILEADDDSLVDTALSGIGVLLGVSGAPRHAWVIRHERAIAQYVPGHLARLHRIEEIARSHPGLYLTGSAYRGISVNACVKDAEAVAARMADDLMKGTTR